MRKTITRGLLGGFAVLGLTAATAPAAMAAPAARAAHAHPLSYYAPDTGAITADLSAHQAVAVKGHGLALIQNAVPLVGSHIQNLSKGGCIKDQGLGATYDVANCSIASNFTEVDNQHTYYYEFIDGNSRCLDETGFPNGSMQAASCNGSDVEEIQPPLSIGAMYTYYDIQHQSGALNALCKGGAVPYDVLDNNTCANTDWAYPGA